MQAVHRALNRIREIEALRSLRDLTDPELLDRFAKEHDEFAFVEIVERHAAMILGVCRRGLTCPHEAEDACQTVFLVLARSAASVRSSGSLGSWLHGVALRVVSRMKRDRTRRTEREVRQAVPEATEPANDLERREMLAVLDEELGRLPERYRSALILCYLEGHSRTEAASRLKTTPGTLHGLLERGRKLLADRLTHRGVALPAGLLTGLVATGSVKAAVPAALVASLGAQGLGAMEMISPVIETMAKQILQEMAMTKLKLTAMGMVGALLLLTAGVGFAQTYQAKDVMFSPAGDTIYLTEEYSVKLADDTDEAFIRRVSQDLRGKEPSATEVHFFVNNKDAKKHQTLVDLFIKEREATAQSQATQLGMRYLLNAQSDPTNKVKMKFQPRTGEAVIDVDVNVQMQLDAARARLKKEQDAVAELERQQAQSGRKLLLLDMTVQPWLEARRSDVVANLYVDRTNLARAKEPAKIFVEALTRSDLGPSFKIASQSETLGIAGDGKLYTQIDLRLEATKRVDLGTINKNYQVVLFNSQGVLMAAGSVDFGAIATLEKGEAVILKVPSVILQDAGKVVIRLVAPPAGK